MIVLELEVDASRVLLSDYHDWHYVLNDYYFATSEAEDEAFEAASHPEEIVRLTLPTHKCGGFSLH